MAGGRLRQQAVTLASSSSSCFSSPFREKPFLSHHHHHFLRSSSPSTHASFPYRPLAWSGVHTPQMSKTVGTSGNVIMRFMQPAAPGAKVHLLPSLQGFPHSSSSHASSPFSLLSLTSPLSPSSKAFAGPTDCHTQQYRTLVTKIKSSSDFSSLIKEGHIHSQRAGKEEEEGKGSSSSVEGVVEYPKLKIVQFSASWCFPCKQISPVVEKWSGKIPSEEVQFFHVDIDECQDLAEEYDISSVPTFLFFKDGKQIKQVTGETETRQKE
ncbi:thioredoxin-like protein tlp1 [Cystoisospora suis]|uniref:Thioredoxin-like protein tlp1 n=1 Tax=Cystoisospora suis TaxID=483139 RepID=A0A2C6KTS3_9APIC|nr:thioredoxin-like protein tlp1 [Cystoisospora suis]